MRLVQYSHNGGHFLGLEVEESGDIINLQEADASIPNEMRTFIECGTDIFERAVRSSCYLIMHL